MLFTNADNLVNMDVMRVFGGKGLDPCSFYRMRRHDIDWVTPEGAPSMTIFQKIGQVDDVTNVEGKPTLGRECSKATTRCPGDYNRGICEALGKGSASPVAAHHQGLHDELYFQAPGDFFLASRQAIHALGGYHQVPSTNHIDALLLCKARGAGMRQVVLVWPCLLLHEPPGLQQVLSLAVSSPPRAASCFGPEAFCFPWLGSDFGVVREGFR